jgi:hypothetical protein
MSGCRPPCSLPLILGNRVRFIAESLNGGASTDERGASGTAVEPQGDGVVVVGALYGLYEDVVCGSLCGLEIEVACVNAGLEGVGEALSVRGGTGTFCILSPEGAERERERRRASRKGLIIIRYLYCQKIDFCSLKINTDL